MKIQDNLSGYLLDKGIKTLMRIGDIIFLIWAIDTFTEYDAIAAYPLDESSGFLAAQLCYLCALGLNWLLGKLTK